MKIDIHCHILPREWPDLKERYGYGGFIRLDHCDACTANMMRDDGHFFRAVDSNLWDAEKRIEECDRDGVDVQIISTVPVMFSYWAKAQDALDLSRILNDHLAMVVQRHPKRFAAMATLPMQEPKLAAGELERCITQLGLCGVEIGTHINDWDLDERVFDPVWEVAQDLGAAIFVHPWDMMGMADMPRYWLPWLVSMPAETSRAFCSLTMGGVLDRFPKLRVVFAHGGGSFPATIARIDHGFDVRPDLCQIHTQTRPSAYLKRVYVDSLVHDPTMLRVLLDRLGSQRIALGTDYPFPLGEHVPGALIEGAEQLSAAVKEQLLSGTALELFGLKREDFETDASRAHSQSLV